MGIDIDRTTFTPAEIERFSQRLDSSLEVLGELLRRPGFGVGPASLGAELEMYIVDDNGKPLGINQEILDAAADPQLTLELNRYNLEYNLTPYKVEEGAFIATEQEILKQQKILGDLAGDRGGRLASIGILPTLTHHDVRPECVTDRSRYHALVEQLIRRRGEKFRIDISGATPLRLELEDSTLEGANTSFQVHYRVAPENYVDTYNAFQLVTPLALGIATNSPTLFGHALWHETRIPVFKQSIDTRRAHAYGWDEPARVHYGLGWARKEPLELFKEVVRIYDPLLPICDDELDPGAQLEQGQVPRLSELRLHQSTVWSWNRVIYDDADGGMLRVEVRALPAGPTPADMVANAALVIGLAEGVRPYIDDLLPGLPFEIAEYNFYRAAQHGLDAKLVWPRLKQHGCYEQPTMDILEDLLPYADEGLANIGVERDERDHYLNIIQKRLTTRRTGSRWQLAMLEKLGGVGHGAPTLGQMLATYMENSGTNTPVAEWTV